VFVVIALLRAGQEESANRATSIFSPQQGY